MLVNNWFVVPGLMQKSPADVIRDINSRRPAATAPIALRDISAIMTADDHAGGIPFLWSDRNTAWHGVLRTSIGEHALILQLETFRGDESKVMLPSRLANVPLSNRIGWDLEVFREIDDALEMFRDAYRRPITANTLQERELIVLGLGIAARAGLLVPEYQAVQAALHATRSGYVLPYLYAYAGTALRVASAAYSAVMGPSPDDNFKQALDAWVGASQQQDLRLLPSIHQQMAAQMHRAMQQYPGCLHLISAGDAHITDNPALRKAGGAPLYQLITLPPNTYGIVDSSTN